MNTNVKLALIAVGVLMSPVCVLASVAPNRPVVRASEHGSVYAKSVPDEQFGHKGKTRVFRVGADRDTLIHEFDWFANEIHIGGEGENTLIRFGTWPAGKPQEGHLALAIYRNGKTLREYSTAEMVRLGSGLSNVIPRYVIFRRCLGFPNDHAFEVEGVSGTVFSIDLKTGAITAKPASEQPGDFLVGKLREYPSLHYSYRLDGNGGDFQGCALFGADERLRQIEPGTRIRVQGHLASKSLGGPKSRSPALVETSLIYMDVGRVELFEAPTAPPNQPPRTPGTLIPPVSPGPRELPSRSTPKTFERY